MTYKNFIENLRAICPCNNTVACSEKMKHLFMSLNKEDADLKTIIAEYSYVQPPVNPVVHKEQGFEMKLLQTGHDFDSEIHDHPKRDVHGFVLKGSIDMTVFDLDSQLSEDQKQLKKISKQSYSEGDYFLIGRDKNNYHQVISEKPAVVLELITPAITAKLAEDTLKYELEEALENDLLRVKKLEEIA